MPFCVECGHVVQRDQKFCRECGTKQPIDEPINKPVDAPPPAKRAKLENGDIAEVPPWASTLPEKDPAPPPPNEAHQSRCVDRSDPVAAPAPPQKVEESLVAETRPPQVPVRAAPAAPPPALPTPPGPKNAFMGVRVLFGPGCLQKKQMELLMNIIQRNGGIIDSVEPKQRARVGVTVKVTEVAKITPMTTHLIVSQTKGAFNQGGPKFLPKPTASCLRVLGYSAEQLRHVVVVRANWVGACMDAGRRIPAGAFRLSSDIGCEDAVGKQGMKPGVVIPVCGCNTHAVKETNFSLARKWNEGKRHPNFMMTFWACAQRLERIKSGYLNSQVAGCDFFQWLKPPLQMKPPSAACALQSTVENEDEEMLSELREAQMATKPQSLDKVRPSSRYTKIEALDQRKCLNPNVGSMSGMINSLRAVAPRPEQAESTTRRAYDGEFSELNVSWIDPDTGERWEAALRGPKGKVEEYKEAAQYSEQSFWLQEDSCRVVEKQIPYPTFLISRNRPSKAHINYHVPHVFGAWQPNRRNPVVVVVVHPSEYEVYRASHPLALFFILPHVDWGDKVGFARWCVQMLAERGLESGGEAADSSLAMPFIWMCDDALVSFQQLEMSDNGKKKIKDAAAGTPMFLRAFTATQNLKDIREYAVVGFLRDRGPACFSKRYYAHNTMSTYKCVLLNIDLLKKHDVRYVRGLSKFEDIAFLHRVLHKAKLKTLKVFTWCYRAILIGHGGASAERTAGGQRCTEDELLCQDCPQVSVEDRSDVDDLLLWIQTFQDNEKNKQHRGREDGEEFEELEDGAVELEAALVAVEQGQILAEEEGSDEDDDDSGAEYYQGDLMKTELRPHQVEALKFMKRVERQAFYKGGILADDMGLGKTVSTLALICTNTEAAASHLEGAVLKPTLIVGPLSILDQWVSEIRRHTDLSCLRHHGTSRATSRSEISAYDVVVTTYDTLVSAFSRRRTGTTDAVLSEKDLWHRVVLDEAHIIRSKKTAAAKAAYLIDAPNRWAVSGTPIMNHESDILSLYTFLGIPHRLADKHRHLIRSQILLRRKVDCLTDLPPLKQDIVEEEFRDPGEEHLYRLLFYHAQQRLERPGVTYAETLGLLIRLRQAALHPYLVAKALDKQGVGEPLTSSASFGEIGEKLKKQLQTGVSGGQGLGAKGSQKNDFRCDQCQQPGAKLMGTPCAHEIYLCEECLSGVQEESDLCCAECGSGFSRQELVPQEEEEVEEDDFKSEVERGGCHRIKSTKLAALLEELSMVEKESDEEKCLVFCSFTGFLDLIQEALKEAGAYVWRLDGSMTKEVRDHNVRSFTRHDGNAILLLSTKVGGVGLNLTAASRVFLCDPGWNPFIESQAISRAHRMGQKREVIVKRFLIRGTIEHQIRNLQQKKARLAENFLEGKTESNGLRGGMLSPMQSTNLSHDDLKRLFEENQGQQEVQPVRVAEEPRDGGSSSDEDMYG